MDMLRYHTLRQVQVGHTIMEQHKIVKKCLNTLKAILLYTSGNSLSSYYGYHGDHDDRVVPAHSFKRRSYRKQTGNDPVLIRIDVKQAMALGNHWQRLFKKMSIFRHSRCIIWVSKNYQKLNNLDFILS
jgi:prolyl oligopeptidase PreP (S9A serine peptidase family)